MTKGFKKGTQMKTKGRKGNFRKEPNKMNLNSPSSSTSTTTSSSSLSADSFATSKYSYGEEEHSPLNIFDTLQNISDESSHEAESDILSMKSLEEDFNFFIDFSDLPDINNVSEDVSISAGPTINKVTPATAKIDKGHFFDPVLGTKLDDYSSSTQSSDCGHIKSVSEESLASSQELSQLNDLVSLDNLLERKSRKTLMEIEEEEEQDLMEALLDLTASKGVADLAYEMDFETLIKKRKNAELQQETLKFIDHLVQKVVEISELCPSEAVLKQNLDKRKLLLELCHINRKYEAECQVSKFLNRKVLYFYRRKNLFSAFTPENDRTLLHNRELYFKALKHLDEQLAKEKNLQQSVSVVATKLRNELQVLKNLVENEVSRFEIAVKRNLCREERPQLNAQVKYLLRIMEKHRKEVSDARFQLITKQHTHEVLLQKRMSLDDLGNGMTVSDYDQVHHKNQKLDKTIEELNIDLEKLHVRLRNNLHSLAHFKEKQSIIKEIIANQSSIFDEFSNECGELRKYVYQLHSKRNQIHKEMNELNVQSGLLNKPALMYDYDQTMVCLREKRASVNSLRVTLETIQQRINKLEKRLTGNSHKFSLLR